MLQHQLMMRELCAGLLCGASILAMIDAQSKRVVVEEMLMCAEKMWSTAAAEGSWGGDLIILHCLCCCSLLAHGFQPRLARRCILHGSDAIALECPSCLVLCCVLEWRSRSDAKEARVWRRGSTSRALTS